MGLQGEGSSKRDDVASDDHVKIPLSEYVEKEKLASIGQTTAVVAHELRNPLATIRNVVFLLKESLTDDTHRQYVDLAERGIQRCDQIIQELLDFTKSTYNKKEWFLLHEEVNYALEEIIKPDNMKVCTDIQALAPFFGVPSKINRAVVNILQNAFDETSEFEQPEVLVRLKQTGDRVWLTIANRGPCIEPDIIGRIFEPLFSTKGFGVGLGLPIARQMFEDHGGKLMVKNLRGRGVVFSGWVPLEEIENV